MTGNLRAENFWPRTGRKYFQLLASHMCMFCAACLLASFKLSCDCHKLPASLFIK
ncbi:unnamed protein product [Brassica napus]|uniref:(rape) hypothetical protein n=1 Tax=Brassica napus TaxID=3708 RepID=A0A816L4M9_BRANA|nr:unnamed protein product [Brassica napus]